MNDSNLQDFNGCNECIGSEREIERLEAKLATARHVIAEARTHIALLVGIASTAGHDDDSTAGLAINRAASFLAVAEKALRK